MADKKADSKYDDLLATIEKMSVLELSELVKAIEERFDVSASAMAAPVAAAPAPGGAEAGGTAEKSEFNVVLKEAGSSKIQVIKAVKDITGKGLTEAKEMTEKLPSTLKEGVKKEEAQELKKKLEEAGATVGLE